MSASADPTHRYALSFTSGALLARESVIPAPLYFDLRDWRVVRDLNDGIKAHYPKFYPALTKITGLEASDG